MSVVTAHPSRVATTGTATGARGIAYAAPSSVTRSSVEVAAAVVALVVAFAGLFGRLMAFPLRHDEQMYLPAGVLLHHGDLYRDFGFNNLPNLPLLMNAIVTATGTDHFLLAGRMSLFVGWLVAALALALVVRRATGSRAVAALAVGTFITNPVLLGPAGMIVTNNFWPIPFALLATHFFIAGIDRPAPSTARLAAAGLCLAVAAGFKANYAVLVPVFAVAALMLPRDATFGARVQRVVAPMLAGGLVGALPVLAYIVADPEGFFTHVVGYHRGPHIAYFAANPDLDGEKIMSPGAKLLLAEQLWFGGTLLLVFFAILAAVAAGAWRASGPPRWSAFLVAALAAAGVVVSFVPTPAFPQYYTVPIPFAIILAALLFARLPAHARAAAAPLGWAAAIVVAVVGGPRLAAGLSALARPDAWTGNRVHAAGRALAAEVARRGDGRLVATLSPVYVLEGGLGLYTELVTGPLVYRVGDLVPRAHRRHYRLVSPSTIAAKLDAMPPAAVLVGYAGRLDEPLADWARRRGYTAVAMPGLGDRYGSAVLYVVPACGPRR